MSIADAYDAMIQDRHYERAIDHNDAVAEVHRLAGTQFDPELVDIFDRLFAATAPTADLPLPTADLSLLGRPAAIDVRVQSVQKRVSAWPHSRGGR